MTDTPFMAVGNGDLSAESITLEDEGRLVRCTICGGGHPLTFGTSDGEKTTLLGAIECPEVGKTFLIAVDGKFLKGERWS
jgi:hypothetical protein